jgi:hypothetical protein
MFYDLQGELFAALIVNKHGDAPFFVNAFILDGKTFYQYSTGAIQEQKLGIAGLGYMAGSDRAMEVATNAGLVPARQSA